MAWCVCLLSGVFGCAANSGTGDVEAFKHLSEEASRAAFSDFALFSDVLESPLVASTREVYADPYFFGPTMVETTIFGSFVADSSINADDVDNVMRRLGYTSPESWQDHFPGRMKSYWTKDDGRSYWVILPTGGEWMTARLSMGLKVRGESEAHGLTELEVPFPMPVDGSEADVVAARAAVVEALGAPRGRVKAALGAEGDYRRADLVTAMDGDSVVTVEATVRSTTCGAGGEDGTGSLKGFTLVQTESSASEMGLASRGGTVLVSCVRSYDKPGRVVFRLARPIRLEGEPPEGLLGTEEVRLG